MLGFTSKVEPRIIEVSFHVDENNAIKGRIYRRKRSKIVFIHGYKPESFSSWKKSLPKDGEEWKCEVIRDTKPDDPYWGAIIVKLIEKIC